MKAFGERLAAVLTISVSVAINPVPPLALNVTEAVGARVVVVVGVTVVVVVVVEGGTGGVLDVVTSHTARTDVFHCAQVD